MRRPSTLDLSALPDPAVLEQLCRRLALVDAILCREWEFRYYSFNGAWDAAAGQRLGSMRDGHGDEWFAVFQAEGVFLRGFAHEAPVRNVPGLFEGVPAPLEPLVHEPAFGDDTTFCCWNVGEGWRRGVNVLPALADQDGSAQLLAILIDDPVACKAHVLDYHERDVPLEALRRIYADEPLDEALLAALAPEVTLAELAEDLAEIGWPVRQGPTPSLTSAVHEIDP
jgi:hypothetical protein